MRKYKELVANTFVFALSNLATKLITFICLPIFTTYLLTSEYGVLDLSQTFINLCVPIFSLSISEAVLRYGLLNRKDSRSVFAVGTRITLISCVIMLPVSILISLFLNVSDLWYYIYVVYVITSLCNLFSAELKAIDKTFIISIGALLSSVFTITLVIVCIKYMQLKLLGYFISMIAGNSVSLLIYFFALIKYKSICFKIADKNIQKEMISYSLPLVPNSVFWWANNGLDKVCLKLMKNIDIAGIYSSAGKIPAILNVFISIFQQAWNISAIKNIKDNDDSFINTMSSLYTYGMMVLASWIIAGLPIITKVFYSGDFVQGIYIIPVLALSVYYTAKSSFIGSMYTANGMSKILFTTTFIGTVFNLIGNILLIHFFGILGASIATCASNIIVFYIRFLRLKKDLDISIKGINSVYEIILIAQSVVYSLKVSTSVLLHLCIAIVITAVALVQMKEYFVRIKKHFFEKKKSI